MRHTSRTSILLDAQVRAAWQEQMALAVNTPDLVPEIMRDRDELLPRFAAYYTQLRALPRRVRRALQRQWRMPLAGVALMLALGQSPGLAATIPVGGSCTLVNAIKAANTDTATGGCPAGSGADTIVLPPGSTQTLTTVNNSTHGPTGLPVISSAITIEGQGSTIRRDSGAPEFRIFLVNSTGDLTLQNTITSGGSVPYDATSFLNTFGGGVANLYGTLTVTNSTISGNDGPRGGGVANVRHYSGSYSGGTLTVTNSTITGNSAGSGGGIYNSNGIIIVLNSIISGNSGGGVINNPGTLTVTNSTISDNSAFSGGGVSNLGGTLTVLNSTISGNSARDYGGGVENGSSVFTLLDSTITRNSANLGGGISNKYGTITMTNSTISGNSAGGYFGGGGVANLDYSALTVLNSTISGNSASVGSSGGVANEGTITMTNSTITGNSAFSGGGVSNFGRTYGSYYGGTLTLTNSTVIGNFAQYGGGGVANYGDGTLTLIRTMVAGNTAPEIVVSFDDAIVFANNHNLFGVNGNAGVVGFTPGPTDIVPPAGVQLSNILNPVLAFNGGPTQTHALVPASPAIDAGGHVCADANGNPLLTDQRGKPRVIDGNRDGTARCDIGAFEFFPVVNNLVTLDPGFDTSFNPTPVPGAPAGSFTIGATFTNTSGTALRFPFFTVTELSGDNLLLNAEGGAQGVGATVTPNVGDQMLSPGETVQVDFVIGLQVSTPFTFFVDFFGEPVSSGSVRSRPRPSATTKTGRR